MPKKVLIVLPPEFLEQIDFVAQSEQRNRSDLVRESLRRYIEQFKRKQAMHVTVSEMRNQNVILLRDSEL